MRRILGTMMICGVAIAQAAETLPTSAKSGPGKTVRLLAIGNSFSQNAATYLPQLAASQGNTLVIQQAAIGGCSLEKHWTLAQKFETDPADKEGRPYYFFLPNGHTKRLSLKEMLESDKWDIVTLQQHSWLSRDLKTYQPFAGELAAYVRKYAPQAKIVVHETWAYRTDDMGLLKKTHTTQEQMYAGLHNAYDTMAREIHADTIIPAGTAFQNVRHDPRWQPEVAANVDKKAYTYPDLPVQKHSLVQGWAWTRKDGRSSSSLSAPEVEGRLAGPGKAGAHELGYDPKHCNTAGKYLLALVWYETIYGDLTRPAFVPKGLAEADAALMREIAHKTVFEGLRPPTTAAVVLAPEAPAVSEAPAAHEARPERPTKEAQVRASEVAAASKASALARVDLVPGEGLASLGTIGVDGGVKVVSPKGAADAICELPVAADAWTAGTIRFMPAADGVVTLKLRGHYSKAGPIWVYFDELKAEGATLENGGFEQAGAGGRPAGWYGDPQCQAQRRSDAGGAKSGEAYAKVCHGGIGTLKQDLHVTKDKPVTLTFWARNAEPMAGK